MFVIVMEFVKNQMNDLLLQNRSFAALYKSEILDDPLLEHILSPPPLKMLHVIYGINLSTEVSALLKKDKRDIKYDICYDSSSEHQLTNWDTVKGIVYETKKTLQKIKKDTGGNVHCSGDGVVPYESLYYPIKWKNLIPSLIFTELEEISHLDILNSEEFFCILAETICERRQLMTCAFNKEKKQKN